MIFNMGFFTLYEVKTLVDNYMTVKEAAEKWNVNVRTVQMMCAEGRIEQVAKFGRSWAIPVSAEKPVDNRIITGKYKNWRKKNRKENKQEPHKK
jgi:excisionase family DNA binding protein